MKHLIQIPSPADGTGLFEVKKLRDPRVSITDHGRPRVDFFEFYEENEKILTYVLI